ncbi:hypothetical protein N7536_007831 [Penicillium majusculum]|uniref:Cytochrome b5 heme-binding domain-containing protein n=1 Tax=Penicillium solitum TaxID=60172 RepID=A0A1V6QUB6_9EURO|nr:uncharacterized protein PENSOL_c039G11325 [Penicillium solitum]KAJ5685212.1 hypothetical protein N7536_007831 [Penicillium majusculum]OQD92617.1 hypothetical protein PENSOL_c039G11325 [Penicillium solitum]
MSPRLVSTKEVARHDSPNDCWLVVDNQVWDVSIFAPDHPGGAEIILRYAGRDATAAYNEVHTPATIKALPPTQLMGQLDPSSIDGTWRNKSTPQTPSQTTAKPQLNAILSTHDFEDAARDSLSKKAWAFYSSTATDLISHNSNQSFYGRMSMRPRLLRNVLTINTQATVLGARVEEPPMANPRLKSVYGEDANSFRPERWLGPELVGVSWGFMPFHGGPKICLGKEFALTEASHAIIRIIQTFPGLRLPPETPILPPGEEKQALTIVVMSAEGCKVLLD